MTINIGHSGFNQDLNSIKYSWTAYKGARTHWAPKITGTPPAKIEIKKSVLQVQLSECS